MPIGNRITPISPEHESIKIINESINSDKKSAIDSFELIDPKYDLLDIITNDQTIKEISSLISLKKDFDKVFNVMGFASTHKYSKKFIVNFYGPPGTGKTITAHAIAKNLGKKILLVDYSEIESKYVGETPKNIKKIFDFSKDKNCIIFFDEADAILSRRVTNMQSATDTSVNQTRSVILNILNDFEGDIIFATNFISNYDPAFMRRISKHIYFELPDFESRIKLFSKYIPSLSKNEVDLIKLARETETLSAADIEKVTLLAAFQACAAGRLKISTQDVQDQTASIIRSKNENGGLQTTTKIVSLDYVKQQLGEKN